MRKRLAHFYAEEIYADNDRSIRSARVVVSMVVELMHPSSVLDVGCGRGNWLSTFIAQGVENVVGLDGDYIKPSKLLFPDRKSTRLNSSHLGISYAVFC